MNFNEDAPLVESALETAKEFAKTLPTLDSGEYFDHIYLHWPVEAFGCVDGAYNVEVVLQNGKWTPVISHRLQDNAVEITDGPYAAHTFHRNSHACGIAIAGMDGATAADFGPDGIQQGELEVFLAVVAAVAQKYGIDASVGNQIMTHAEAAVADDYFPERWDLSRLNGEPGPLEPSEAGAMGTKLRHRIHLYKLKMA